MTSATLIIGVFFIIGITVGVITVLAMSAFRRDRRGEPGDWRGYGPDGPDERPPDLHWGGILTGPGSWWQARDDE